MSTENTPHKSIPKNMVYIPSKRASNITMTKSTFALKACQSEVAMSPGQRPRSSKPEIGGKFSGSVRSSSGTISAIKSDKLTLVHPQSGNNNMPKARPIPYGPEVPKLVIARVFVTFQKHYDGLYHGQIVILNIHDSPVAFKVDTTDPDLETFEFSPSNMGIIWPKGKAKVKVVTETKLGWGDVRKHLFLLQSSPIILLPNVREIDAQRQTVTLLNFWEEDHNLKRSEKMLLLPKLGNPVLLTEPSILEEAVQGYLKSRFVRLNRYLRMWYKPCVLDHPLIKKNYPEAFRQLEQRVWKESWFQTFKKRYDLISCEKQRYKALESAYEYGWNQAVNLFICFAVLCFSAWWFWNGKITWDGYVAARDRPGPWYRKLMGYFR